MRRSTNVAAPLLASAAVALLAGCHDKQPQRCVNEQNHFVDPKFCQNLPPGSAQPVAGSMGNGGGSYDANGNFVPHYFRYYYGGSYGGGFNDTVTGGSFAPSPGVSYGVVSRGGFGSSFGGGGGEGGGGE